MAEKQKLDIKALKTRIKEGFGKFVLFFKEFKWDKAHLTVLGKYLFEVLFFAFIITFDLCMKEFLYDFVEVRHGGNYTVIDGFLDLTYSENTGMGFGFGKNSTLGITIITAIVIAAILGYLLFFKKEKAYIRIPLIMVAAGGIGNLVDRTQLGYVRDFFEFTFMDFAIFNIADAFVTVGAIVLIIALIVIMFKPQKKEESAEGGGDGGKTAFTVTDADGLPVGPRTEDVAEDSASDDGESSAETGANEEKTETESSFAKHGGEDAPRAAFTIAPKDDGGDGKDDEVQG